MEANAGSQVCRRMRVRRWHAQWRDSANAAAVEDLADIFDQYVPPLAKCTEAIPLGKLSKVLELLQQQLGQPINAADVNMWLQRLLGDQLYRQQQYASPEVVRLLSTLPQPYQNVIKRILRNAVSTSHFSKGIGQDYTEQLWDAMPEVQSLLAANLPPERLFQLVLQLLLFQQLAEADAFTRPARAAASYPGSATTGQCKCNETRLPVIKELKTGEMMCLNCFFAGMKNNQMPENFVTSHRDYVTYDYAAWHWVSMLCTKIMDRLSRRMQVDLHDMNDTLPSECKLADDRLLQMISLALLRWLLHNGSNALFPWLAGNDESMAQDFQAWLDEVVVRFKKHCEVFEEEWVCKILAYFEPTGEPSPGLRNSNADFVRSCIDQVLFELRSNNPAAELNPRFHGKPPLLTGAQAAHELSISSTHMDLFLTKRQLELLPPCLQDAYLDMASSMCSRPTDRITLVIPGKNVDWEKLVNDMRKAAVATTKSDYDVQKWKKWMAEPNTESEKFLNLQSQHNETVAEAMEAAKHSLLAIEAREALLALTHGDIDNSTIVPPTVSPVNGASREDASLNGIATFLAELQFHNDEGDLLPAFQELCGANPDLLSHLPPKFITRVAHLVKASEDTRPLIGAPNSSPTMRIWKGAVVVFHLWQAFVTSDNGKREQITGKPQAATDRPKSTEQTGVNMLSQILIQVNRPGTLAPPLTQIGDQHQAQQDYAEAKGANEMVNEIVKKSLQKGSFNEYVAWKTKTEKTKTERAEIVQGLNQTFRSALLDYAQDIDQMPVVSLHLRQVLDLMIEYMDREVPIGPLKTAHTTRDAWLKVVAIYKDGGEVQTAQQKGTGRKTHEQTKGQEKVHEVPYHKFIELVVPSNYSLSHWIRVLTGSDPFEQNQDGEGHREAVNVALHLYAEYCIDVLKKFFECETVKALLEFMHILEKTFQDKCGYPFPDAPTAQDLNMLTDDFRDVALEHPVEVWNTVLTAEKKFLSDQGFKRQDFTIQQKYEDLKSQFQNAALVRQELLWLVLAKQGTEIATIDVNGTCTPCCGESNPPCPFFLLLTAMSSKQKVKTTDERLLAIIKVMAETITTDVQKEHARELIEAFTEDFLMGTPIRLGLDEDGRVRLYLLVVESDYSTLRPVQPAAIGALNTFRIGGHLPPNAVCQPFEDVLEKLSQQPTKLTPDRDCIFNEITEERQKSLQQSTSVMATYLSHTQTSKNPEHESTQKLKEVQAEMATKKRDCKRQLTERNPELSTGGDHNEVADRCQRMQDFKLKDDDFKPKRRKNTASEQPAAEDAILSPSSSINFELLGSAPEDPQECEFCRSKLIENGTKCPMMHCVANEIFEL